MALKRAKRLPGVVDAAGVVWDIQFARPTDWVILFCFGVQIRYGRFDCALPPARPCDWYRVCGAAGY
eukprot:6358936-Lingulodinium_polyedra.AAC.1